jgi:hypothetical protein
MRFIRAEQRSSCEARCEGAVSVCVCVRERDLRKRRADENAFIKYYIHIYVIRSTDLGGV